MKKYFTINNQFKKYLPIFMIMLSIVLLMGTSYALLRSSQKGENAYVMSVGLLEVTFVDSETNALTLTNMIPITDEEGMDNDKELEFTVKNTGDFDAKYNVYIEETSTSPSFKTVIRFISNKNDSGYNDPKTLSDNKFIDTLAELKVGETATYKVKVWLDESADATYMNKTFTARIVVETVQGDAPASYYIQKSINESTCNPTVVEDGITYLSGDNECINFNYVWYSGKLWRITAINPDGSMKMITEDIITTINWGKKTTVSDIDLTSAYSTSWIREWLNQEFLPTLYNYENIIVEDAGWYSITDSSELPVKPTGDYTLTDPVGLLNAYEYYMSYKNLNSYENGYLNIGYYWWVITPYSSSNMRYVHRYAYLNSGSPSIDSRGVRPSINLKSTIQLSGGTGTIEDPYIIKDDIEEATANTTLLNTRYSGEYVKLEDDESNRLFRIVDKELVGEKLTTKLVLDDYIKESDDVLTKSFSGSSSHELWSEVDNTDVIYWRGYLNITWLGTFDTSMLEKGTYYLGYYTSDSYKTTVCSTVSSETSIKECILNGTVVNNISSGDYVGLLRVGEMFASQPSDYMYSTASDIWLITPYNSSNMRIIYSGGDFLNYNSDRNSVAVRPTINLTSSVVIKSGSGTEWDPFVVGLPE